MKWLGKGSGVRGFAFVCTFPIFMGGSLFTVFPLLKSLREKGARTGAIASFITAWGGKAPLLPLETKFLGWHFALVRLGFVIIFAFFMGLLMDWVGEKRTTLGLSYFRKHERRHPGAGAASMRKEV